jgi:hypothetical protein
LLDELNSVPVDQQSGTTVNSNNSMEQSPSSEVTAAQLVKKYPYSAGLEGSLLY